MKNKVFKIFVIMILSVNISYAGSNPKIDKATFQEIDAVYAKDKNGVYVWENRGWKKLEGIDPITFQIINIFHTIHLLKFMAQAFPTQRRI